MREITYLIYILLYETLVLGGCGYAVFILGHSGWWFLLAIYMSGAAYSPGSWIYGYVRKARWNTPVTEQEKN